MDTIEKALQKHKSEDESKNMESPVDNPSLDHINPDSLSASPENSKPIPSGDQTLSTGKLEEGVFPKRRVDLELDLYHLASLGIIVPDDKRSKLKEEYKHIKRPLLQKASLNSAHEDHNNLIMVTSAYSGEGKTFSSLNLALSIAVERDRRVLLVDADVVKPGLGRLLQAGEKPGLVEYLNGDVDDLSTLLLTTNVHNLTLLPAGKTHHLSHELLASNAMRDLADELASRYPDRVIIFDSSPLLVTSESRVLAQLVGQIAIVVEQDKTAQSAVLEAVESVENSKISGMILNKSKDGADSYYGYYYSKEKE